MRQTSLYIPNEVIEMAKAQGVNMSQVATQAIMDTIKHPGFRKKMTERRRIEDKLKFCNPKRLNSMKRSVTEDKSRAPQWVKMMKIKEGIELTEEEILKWSFGVWDEEVKK